MRRTNTHAASHADDATHGVSATRARAGVAAQRRPAVTSAARDLLSPVRPTHGIGLRAICVMTAAIGVYAPGSWASCTVSANVTTCLGATTTTIGTGASMPTGSQVVIGTSTTTATLNTGNTNGISLSDNSTIEIGSGSIVENTATTVSGLYGKGGNTIEFRTGNTLTIDSGAQVKSTGTQTSAEAVNPQGGGNTINNNGSITATTAAAIWFDNGTLGTNTVNNTGVISGSGTAISSGGVLDFTNSATGVISGAISAGNASTFSNAAGGTVTGNVTVGSNSTVSNAGKVSGTLTAGGSSTVSITGTLTGTLSVGALSTVTLGAGSSSAAVTIAGASNSLYVDAGATFGTLTLTGPNNLLTLTGSASSSGSWTKSLASFSQITQTSTGVWTLVPTVAPPSTATITVANGTMVLGAASLASVSSMTVGANATLKGPGSDMSATVFDSGLVDFNETTGSNYTGQVSGTGNVLKEGTGTLTLASTNGFTGTTSVTGGTLIASVAHALGATTSIDIANGATLRTDTTGAMGAVPSTEVDGTLNLNNTSQSLGMLSGASTGAITLGSGTLTTQSDSDSEFDGVVSGTGTVTKLGAGTLTLAGNNTYIGVTTLSAGAIQIGNGGTSGALSGDIVNNAALSFNRSDSTTYAGTISGTGVLSQAGTGTLTLSANNTYTGVTTIAAGTLALGAGGNSGSVAGDIANHGALVFDRNDIWTYGGTLSGAGTVLQAGTGTTILTAENTDTGVTTISGGTLQLGSGGTSGDVGGAIVDNATLTFDRSDAHVIANAISGTGDVVQSGSGAVALTADNTYTGTTSIASGSTLQLGNGGTTGSITSNVSDAGTLIFNRSDAVVFSPTISGTGSVVQAGTDTLEFDTAQLYTGSTQIEAGTLDLESSLASGTTTIAAGATLTGTGTLAGSVINNGIVAPGNPALTPTSAAPGTSSSALAILGDDSGGNGEIYIRSLLNVGGAGGQTTDRLLVAGTLSGTSTLVVTPLAGSTGAQTGNHATDGISVIQAGPASTSAAVSLAGGYVAGGPYQYRLFTFAPGQSSASALDARLAAAGVTSFTDYRLQTVTVLSGTDPSAPAGLPVGVGPNGEAPGETVVVPQVRLYQALPTGTLAYGLALSDELHKRVGDLTPASEDGIDTPTAELFTRAKDWRANINAGLEPSYDQHLWFAQTGAGVVLPNVFEGGDRLNVDLVMSQGGSTSQVLVNQASTHFDATSIGVASTYRARSGAYLDGVVQGVFYNNITFDTVQRGRVGETVGRAELASLQGGLPLSPGEGTTFEPRASLSFQHTGFNPLTDIDQVQTHLGSSNSLVADIGLRISHPFDLRAVARTFSVEPFVSIDYANDLLGAHQIAAGAVNFASAGAGHFMRVGGGASVRMGASVAGYLGFEHDMSVAKSSPTGNEIVATVSVRF